MSSSLSPCPSCSRHVRASEASCPFCQALLAPSDGAARSPAASMAAAPRLSRAAAYALGASLAVAGCSTTTDPNPRDGGTTPDAAGSTDGGVDAATDGSAGPDDGGNIQPPYGAPAYGAPPVDGGR